MIVAEVRSSGCGSQVQSEVDDRHQHQQRGQERVEEELDASVDAALTAPDTDDEVHRYQHHLPHHVEEEQIAGEKYTEHTSGQDQQQSIVAPNLGADARPASE